MHAARAGYLQFRFGNLLNKISSMIEEDPKPKLFSVSEFKAHCTEQLRALEEQSITLEIIRHEKVVAMVEPAKPEGPTMEEWIGSGAGLMKEGAANLFDEPTWEPGEWNMEKDDEPR